jgi:hypothetical protein
MPSNMYLPVGRQQHGEVGFQGRQLSVPLTQMIRMDKPRGLPCGNRRISITMYVARVAFQFELNMKLKISDYHWNLLNNRQSYPGPQQ